MNRSAIRALTASIYPQLQCSRPFEDIMLKIMRGLSSNHLPSDNDVIKAANQSIIDNPNVFLFDHHAFAPLSKHDVVILEYILAEIIEFSGHVTTENNKKRLIPMSVVIAVYNDPDLNDIIKAYIDDYIPTLSELKSLGGIRWALYFMHGSDPYKGLEKYENSKTVYPAYEEWYKGTA